MAVNYAFKTLHYFLRGNEGRSLLTSESIVNIAWLALTSVHLSALVACLKYTTINRFYQLHTCHI
ncbi:hypothetical protein [Nostoc sp.]